jgi:hypothetical protein
MQAVMRMLQTDCKSFLRSFCLGYRNVIPSTVPAVAMRFVAIVHNQGATLSCVYAAIGPAPVSRGRGERGTDEPPAFLKIAFGFACLFVPLFKKSSHES